MAIVRIGAARSAVWIALLLLGRSALGQQAGQPLKTFHLSTWAGDSGPPLPAPNEIARTTDGYLWIGARGGLLRFDGVRFAVLDSTVSPVLRAKRRGDYAVSLVDRDGWLWLTRPDGRVVQYREGVFREVESPDNVVGTAQVVGRDGSVWLGGISAPLRIWRNGRVERPELPAGVPDTGVRAMARDTGGGVWLGTETQGLWHIVGSHAEAVVALNARFRSVQPLLQARDGTLWVRDQAGLYRYINGQPLRPVLLGHGEPVVPRSVIEDSLGAVWIATAGQGVLRWSHGALEQFDKADGLSSDVVMSLIPGGAGSVWVLTEGGALHQLRPTSFTTVSRSDRGSLENAYRFVEDGQGALWGELIGRKSAVLQLQGGALDGSHGPPRSTRATLPAAGMYEVLAGARGGGVWIGPLSGGLIRYRPHDVLRWGRNDGLPIERFGVALETRDGALWVANVPGSGFGRIRNRRFANVALPGATEPRIPTMVEDGRGHLWVPTARDPFIYEFEGDRLVRRLGPEQGMRSAVAGLTHERGDTLWGIVGDSGLIRIAGGRAAFIATPGLHRLLSVRSGLTTSGNYLWLVGAGVARVPLPSLHAAVDGKAVDIVPRFFSPADGIATPRNNGGSPVPIFRARDGRVWISTPGGLAVVDPLRQWFDSTPPRLHIEELSSEGRVIAPTEGFRIPPRPASVSVRYTAISAVSPERARIQYRLDGADESWVDAVGPRIATYTKLRPGAYTFRVRAWNVDGVESDGEATLRFRVLAAWYETTIARVAGVLLIALIGAAGALTLQRRQARRAAEVMRSQYEATLAERTRIARELHDSLLQDFTGITLMLAALREPTPASSNGNGEMLNRIVSLAKRSLFEARHSVWDLRATSLEQEGIVAKLEALRAMSNDQTKVDCYVRGSPHVLEPRIEAMVLHVAREGVSNAVRHARARSIALELSFEPESVALTVRDDGEGMSTDRQQQASKAGHFGLVGMRERVESEGGTLVVTSTPGAGTTISLSYAPNDAAGTSRQ